MKNIVLVHGGLVDGAGWEGVYQILKKDGYKRQHRSLEDDVAVTRRTLASLDGESILVGHSYGGAVITEAGTAGLHRRLCSGQRRVRARSAPGPMGRGSPQRHHQRSRLESQTKLVPGHDRG
jgi:pimeloyl-ACP methyl ester carboxylesterase